MKDDIKLPPLPKGDIDAGTCPVMWVHTDRQIETFAREAIKADRQKRWEPVIWHAPNCFPDSLPNTWSREVVAVTNFRSVFSLSCMGTYWQRPRDFAEGEYVDAWADFPDIEQQRNNTAR